MRVARRFRFYAAHRNPCLSDKCARLHGHRYGVEVEIEVSPGHGGIGILFAKIDEALSAIFEALDHHTLLSHDDPFTVFIPTEQTVIFPFPTSAENLAAWLLARCRAKIPGCVSLSLTETDSSTIKATIEDLESWPTS